MAIPAPVRHITRFEKIGYGMFIHWGLSDHDAPHSPAGRGDEWIAIGKVKRVIDRLPALH